MRKLMMLAGACLAQAVLFAADPGGTPGLMKAVFTGSAFDRTSDVGANAIGYTCYPEEMYATSCPEKTTYAWAGYMLMMGGVTYNFKGCYDDYVTVKIAGNWVISKGGESEDRSGSYTPTATDWYEIEFRVGNNRGKGGCLDSSQCGILWNTAEDTIWRKVMDCGTGMLFKSGRAGLANVQHLSVPAIISSKIRANDKSIMDIAYIVSSPKTIVDVRAVAFQDGERGFEKAILPKTFIADENGQETSGNIGTGVPANTQLNLSWKIPSDLGIDIAKVKFEILVSDVAQLPLKTLTIPATAKNPAMTVNYNQQSDDDIFNALMWYWAGDETDLHLDGSNLACPFDYFPTYITNNGSGVRPAYVMLDDLYRKLRYLYIKMGWEPIEGGNLLNYVRRSIRKDVWFNSWTQTAAIKTSTKPDLLYIGEKAYCVIDVSGGSDAVSYPVTYLDAEPVNGWGDEYKTTKILLRRCETGKIIWATEDCWRRELIATEPFYIGVFEISQKQCELVLGDIPNHTPNLDIDNEYIGDLHPVTFSMEKARGNDSIAPESFIGKIRAKTGLSFDLPTTNQWQYAARAGVPEFYYNGDRWFDYSSLVFLGSTWYSRIVDVGHNLPNLWGLYDWHTNGSERCLDGILGNMGVANPGFSSLVQDWYCGHSEADYGENIQSDNFILAIRLSLTLAE